MPDIYPTRDLSATLFPYQPQAALSFNRGLASNVAGSVPSGVSSDPFQTGGDTTSQIINLLRQYQSGLQQRGYATEREQALRLAAPPPPGLVGAPLNLQDVVRGADVGALQPTLGGLRGAIGEAGDLISYLNQIQQQQEKQRNDAYKRIHDEFTQLGGQAFSSYDPQTKAAIEKAAGVPKGYLDQFANTMTLREKQLNLQQEKLAQSFGQGKTSGTIDAMADAVISGDLAPSQLPGFGQNSLKAKVLARVFQKDPTFNAAKAEQQFSFGKSNKAQLIQFSIKSVTSAQKIIKDLSNKVKRSDIQPINAAELQFRSRTGSVPTAKFLGAIKILGDEYGAVFGQGAATDFKAQLGLAVLDPTLSNEQFNGLIDTTIDFMKARSDALQQQAGQAPVFQTNQPNTRIIKGKSYTKKSDGLWYPQ